MLKSCQWRHFLKPHRWDEWTTYNVSDFSQTKRRSVYYSYKCPGSVWKQNMYLHTIIIWIRQHPFFYC